MKMKVILALMLCALAPILIISQESAEREIDPGLIQADENQPEEIQSIDKAEPTAEIVEEEVEVEEETIPPTESQPTPQPILNIDTDKDIEEDEDDQQPLFEEGIPSIDPSELDYNIEERRKQVIDLVNRGVAAMKKQPLDVVYSKFSHSKEFVVGDLYLFVYDMNGICLAHGEDPELIWKNLIDLTDWVGTPIVKEILKKAEEGGGWVTYGWHNSTKVAYIQRVDLEGKSYAVGSGYYPQSKRESVVNLVKGGVALFEQIKKDGDPIDWAFSRMSYPRGKYIAGNLYLYALDFNGNMLAQGERPGLIGSNAWDYKDEKGKYVNREIIKALQNTTEGVWVEYVSKRALKSAYAEKVKDREGKEYFIACGYYPDADRDQTVELVRKGYQFMKTSGVSAAVEAFTQRRSDDYRYGDLDLVVYDMKGKIVASGNNPDSIGINMMDALDEDGFPYVKAMVTRATKEGIWVNAKIKGSFQSTYAQNIDLGVDNYVITCSYYPVSKPETMLLLVQSAASFLRSHTRAESFSAFKDPNGMFRRGNLEVFVIDIDGLCYVWGDDVNLIWRNILLLKDEDGRPFVKLFINESKLGATIVKTKFNSAVKTNYIVRTTKKGKSYIIGSGYYN